MRLATIDIGTNSVKLLIARSQGGALTPIKEEIRLCRLGQGSQKDFLLKPDAIERTVRALTEFKDILDREPVERFVVAATMGVRQATNRAEFLARVESAVGWKIRVLSGDEEARLSFHGARSLWPSLTPPIAGLDIGGGSTEWILEIHGKPLVTLSLAIGGVRGTEEFLPHHPASEEDCEAFRAHLRALVKTIRDTKGAAPAGTPLIAIGGTATSLQGLLLPPLHTRTPSTADSPILKSEGDPTLPMNLKILRELSETLRKLSVDDRLATYPRLHPGRADVILAGSLILEMVMDGMGFSECLVSPRGLRWGLAAELLK